MDNRSWWGSSSGHRVPTNHVASCRVRDTRDPITAPLGTEDTRTISIHTGEKNFLDPTKRGVVLKKIRLACIIFFSVDPRGLAAQISMSSATPPSAPGHAPDASRWWCHECSTETSLELNHAQVKYLVCMRISWYGGVAIFITSGELLTIDPIVFYYSVSREIWLFCIVQEFTRPQIYEPRQCV